MGKHHTYRKRGTATLAPSRGPDPPPAATTYRTGNHIWANTNTTHNAGGQITLYRSYSGEDDTWFYADTSSWEELKDWGDHTGYGESWWRTDHAGNGIDYSATTTTGPKYHYIP